MGISKDQIAASLQEELKTAEMVAVKMEEDLQTLQAPSALSRIDPPVLTRIDPPRRLI